LAVTDVITSLRLSFAKIAVNERNVFQKPLWRSQAAIYYSGDDKQLTLTGVITQNPTAAGHIA
jgi:hypothetical protein